jgi:hypothetical protein
MSAPRSSTVLPKLCLDCRYTLEGIASGICPECGRTFDPEQPPSYFTPRYFMLTAWLGEPPHRGHFLLAGIAAVLTLFAFSAFATRGWPLFVAVPLWGAVLATSLLRILARTLVPRRRHRSFAPRRGFYRRTAILWSMPPAVFLIIYHELPVGLRLFDKLSTFTSVANRFEASGFNVLDIEDRTPGVPEAIAAFGGPGRVFIELGVRHGTGFVNRRWDGIARIRGNTATVRTAQKTLRHLYGDWYLWRDNSFDLEWWEDWWYWWRNLHWRLGFSTRQS